MAPSRTLHVRLGTWDQVEVFATKKLRRGKLLSMKVPFAAEAGGKLTLGLELPNGVVIAIDSIVQKTSPVDGTQSSGKTWIELELTGFTPEVVERIKKMQAGLEHGTPTSAAVPVPPVGKEDSSPTLTPANTPPPVAELAPRRRTNNSMAPLQVPPPTDERSQFQELTTELRRMRTLAVHEVLGVAPAADANEVRAGWMALVQRYHPDLYARFAAPAITHLAEELMILVNRAYDRLRLALVAEGRALSAGSVLHQPPGWLVGWDDIASARADGEPTRPRMASSQMPPLSLTTAQTAPPASAVQGGEAFEVRARAMLGEGNPDNAQEVLAAALCVYPRSRPLRSLYYVASALGAIAKGEVMLATSQLETALAHYEQCSEAAALLEHVRRTGTVETSEMRRLFT